MMKDPKDHPALSVVHNTSCSSVSSQYQSSIFLLAKDRTSSSTALPTAPPKDLTTTFVLETVPDKDQTTSPSIKPTTYPNDQSSLVSASTKDLPVSSTIAPTVPTKDLMTSSTTAFPSIPEKIEQVYLQYLQRTCPQIVLVSILLLLCLASIRLPYRSKTKLQYRSKIKLQYQSKIKLQPQSKMELALYQRKIARPPQPRQRTSQVPHHSKIKRIRYLQQTWQALQQWQRTRQHLLQRSCQI